VICRARSSFPHRKGSCKLFQAAARLHGEGGKESDAFPSGEHARPISIDRWFPRVVPKDVDSCEVVGRFSGEVNVKTASVRRMICFATATAIEWKRIQLLLRYIIRQQSQSSPGP
jgi:hypothetical protein